MAEIFELWPRDNMTPEEVLSLCIRADLKEVLILGYYQDGSFISIASKMTAQNVLWLTEKQKKFIIDEMMGSD